MDVLIALVVMVFLLCGGLSLAVAAFAYGGAGILWLIDRVRPSAIAQRKRSAELRAWAARQPRGTFSWDRDED